MTEFRSVNIKAIDLLTGREGIIGISVPVGTEFGVNSKTGIIESIRALSPGFEDLALGILSCGLELKPKE